MSPAPDPELAQRVARNVQLVYSDAAAEMLEKVAKRLAQGVTEPGWAEAKLADIGRLRAELGASMKNLDAKAVTAMAQAVTDSFVAGGEGAGVELGGGFTRNSGRALNALIREAIGGVAAGQQSILRAVMDDYRQIVALSSTRITIGTQTRLQAAQKALDEFAARGIRGFRDSAGRNWEIESYAEMATRTASGRAAVAGGLDRLQDRGHDLVIVSNAPEECSICRRWEGKVLSISGSSQGDAGDGVHVAATVSEAEGAGLLHANCRHNLSAYVPGLTRVPTHTADPDGDRQRQTQRRLERGVRVAKRRVAAQKGFVEQLRQGDGTVPPEAQAALRRAQAEQKAATARLVTFVDENDRKRLRYREGLRGGRSGPPQAPPPPPPPPPRPAPRPLPRPTLPPAAPSVPPTPHLPTSAPAGARAPKAQFTKPDEWKQAVNLDWGKLPKAIAARYEKAFDAIAADYPAITRRLDWMGDWTTQLANLGYRKKNVPRAIAVTRSTASEVGIGFMRGHHASLTKLENTVAANKAAGHLAVGQVEGILVHEVGHVASHVLRSGKVPGGFRFYDRVEEVMRDEFAPGMPMAQWRSSAARFDAMRAVSRYAATTQEEFVAECFASYRLDPNPPPAARIVGSLMDQVLRSLS